MSLTLRTYRTNLGWSLTRFAKEAGVARGAIKNAEIGHIIRPDTAKAIADALSRALGEKIQVSDIKGLNIL
jgi:transcriptional regulator with XRE-family HTH domain